MVADIKRQQRRCAPFPSSLGMTGEYLVCERLSHIDGSFSTSNHESQAILAATLQPGTEPLAVASEWIAWK
jgi:hypothetical protein